MASTMSLQEIRQSIKWRKLQDRIFMYLSLFCLFAGLFVLITLVLQLFVTSIGFSLVKEDELQRATVRMVDTIGTNPDAKAKNEIAELKKVIEEARKQRLLPLVDGVRPLAGALEKGIADGSVPKDKGTILQQLEQGLGEKANTMEQFNTLSTAVNELVKVEKELPASVVQLLKQAQETLPSVQGKLFNLVFTPEEEAQFTTAFNRLYEKVNPYAREAARLPYVEESEREKAQEQLESQNPAMAEIFDLSKDLCTGAIYQVFGLWVCEVPSKLTWQFLNLPSSASHEYAGVRVAIFGSVGVIMVMAVVAIPLGIAAGVFLEEYAPKNLFTTLIELNINNLAGVPAIVYGILALGFFKVYFGPSILTGGLTLACLVLPVIIVTTREAIRAIPVGIREGAFALGATKWRVVQDHLLPYSLGGILTGVIVAVSRAIGEASPLITIGAAGLILFTPFEAPPPANVNLGPFNWLLSQFTALPILMFDWVQRPQRGFQTNSAAAGVVLVILTLILNGTAIWIRSYSRRRIKW